MPARREKSEQERVLEDMIRIVHTEESESKWIDSYRKCRSFVT